MTTDTYAEQRATDRLRLAEMERRSLAVSPATGTRATGAGHDRHMNRRHTMTFFRPNESYDTPTKGDTTMTIADTSHVDGLLELTRFLGALSHPAEFGGFRVETGVTDHDTLVELALDAELLEVTRDGCGSVALRHEFGPHVLVVRTFRTSWELAIREIEDDADEPPVFDEPSHEPWPYVPAVTGALEGRGGVAS